MIYADTGSEITLQPGVQTCPLSFVLPNNVPSSFHGAYGFTRYKMKVVVDRINRLNDSIEIPIIVIRQLNLNNEPPEMKVEVTSSQWWIQRGGNPAMAPEPHISSLAIDFPLLRPNINLAPRKMSGSTTASSNALLWHT